MDNLSLETIAQVIGTVGFPSLVAIILLRSVLGNFNSRLDTLDKRLVQLNKSIVMVAKTLNQVNKEEASILMESTNSSSNVDSNNKT
ncbi:hypothetical protein AB1I68_15660 [Paenibacillus pabuli]|uniref:hypothetical protein n=1 Tax=Paenibacillus pabuli TaxID=1472 RepID=UPI00345ABF10